MSAPLAKEPSLTRRPANDGAAGQTGFTASLEAVLLADRVGMDAYEFESKTQVVKHNPNLRVQKLSVRKRARLRKSSCSSQRFPEPRHQNSRRRSRISPKSRNSSRTRS